MAVIEFGDTPAGSGWMCGHWPMTDRPDISVLIPLYNEEDSIQPLLERIFFVLRKTGRSFEIVAVNDGSQDASLSRLRDVAARCRDVKVVNLRRNYGQTAAMMAGIEHASGAILVSEGPTLKTKSGFST
jgi:dolichol-phosphate mannosyltransferase